MTIPTPKQLIEAGVHIGRKKSKWNPKMTPFVFGVRNNIHILDVNKTLDALGDAIDFLKDIKSSGGKILFVGVKIQSRDIVRKTAEELDMPYVINRWIGGLFTNFKIVKERINFLEELERRQTGSEIKKYTKKEQLQFSRQLKKLREEIGGIKNLEKLPQAIIVSNMEREMAAILEAKKMKIPVVAIADTDADPTLVEWPVPANDSSISSLGIVYSTIGGELKKVSVKPKEDPLAPGGEKNDTKPEKEKIIAKVSDKIKE